MGDSQTNYAAWKNWYKLTFKVPLKSLKDKFILQINQWLPREGRESIRKGIERDYEGAD